MKQFYQKYINTKHQFNLLHETFGVTVTVTVFKGVGKCFQRETVEGEKELNCNICDKGVENNFK